MYQAIKTTAMLKIRNLNKLFSENIYKINKKS